MRYKRIFSTGGICVILTLLSSLLTGGDVWGQCTPTGNLLEINYTSLLMSSGASQNLSASGGCPPYNWNLSGGGTLTPSGGDNTSAPYVAPASNANCTDNPTITLTDCCRNTAEIKIAVSNDSTAPALKYYEWNYVGEYWWNDWCPVVWQYEILEHTVRCDGSSWISEVISEYANTVPIVVGSYGVVPKSNDDVTACIPAGCFYNCPDLWCYPDNCPSWFAGLFAKAKAGSWLYYTLYDGLVVDSRTSGVKQLGCCPNNPSTGLPFDETPDSEDQVKNAGDPGCNSIANPVNVGTGNKYEKVLDLSISTPGIPVEFRRSYNGKIIFDGSLGYGWTHTYDVSLGVVQTSPKKRIRIWDSDGKALYFSEVQQTSTEILFGGESGVKDKLKQAISTGEYFLRRKNGNLTYRFGSDGKLLTISDPNGNALTFTYTGGLLTQVSNNFGKTLTIQYTYNRISSVTDPKNQSVLYEYTSGDLTKVTYPDTNFIRYAYSNHNLTDKHDADNNLIGHWGYDNRHRVITYYSHLKDGVPQEGIDLTYQSGGTIVTKSTGATTYTTSVIDSIGVVTGIDGCSACGSVKKSFQYSNRGDLTDATSIDGTDQYTTQYTYDNPTNPWDQVGEILQMTEAVGWPEQRTTSYTYTHRTDDPFLLTQRTETRKSVVDSQQNKVTTISYDNQGNILSRQESGYVFINGVSTPKTYTTQYQYNTLGQLTQIDGPRTDVSDVTTLEYYANTSDQGNNQGQVKATVNALGQRTQFSNYDTNGNIGTITDPNNVITQRTYDEKNRIKTITNLSTGSQTQYFYDIRGNLSSIIFPEANRIDFTYNLANKLTEIKDSLNNKIQYQYDVDGNRSREETKDPQGTPKKYLDFTYDAYNNLKKIINPDSTYTEYTYDGRKKPTSIKDPKSKTTTYTYDPLSRIKQMTQPLSTITLYGYDTQDNEASIIDPKENTTQYWSDDFGRKNQTASPDTGTTDYLYDEAGNLIQRFDAKETVVNYTYDALNRLTAIQFPSDPNQNVFFTYDSTSVSYGIGRLTGRADPSGSYTFYYDPYGNLTREDKTINSILYTTQYTYNNNNILTSITYPTGRTITYTLDQTGRISQVSTTLGGSPKTLASAITYLPFGEITDLSYGNGLSLSHGYDNQYRISSKMVGSILNLAYGYDPNGNIISIQDWVNPLEDQPFDATGTYTYQQGTNKLTHIEAAIPTGYGYDPNGNITSENSWTHVYDLSNQLIRVLDNTNQVAEYTYNGAGQRIKKVAQTETRIFHYDLWGHLIAETNQNGQTIAEYIYLTDQLLAMIKLGEAVYYYHNDHLGTPKILTDGNGSIAWKALYTPFGEALVSIETVENPFRFPGQYYDRETGFHYNYFRYYDPTTRRYVTPDPIGLEGGINLFAYVANNPVNMIDPEGYLGKIPKTKKCIDLLKKYNKVWEECEKLHPPPCKDPEKTKDPSDLVKLGEYTHWTFDLNEPIRRCVNEKEPNLIKDMVISCGKAVAPDPGDIIRIPIE